MTITSKFASTCKSCGTRIAVGEQINWERGQGAKHVKCPQVSRERAWITSQPKNIRDGYRMSADERAEYKAMRELETAEYYGSLPIPAGTTPNGLLDL